MSKIIIGSSSAGNGINPSSYRPLTVDFSATIVFDVFDKYTSITQTSDINLTLASSGHIDNSNCTLVINPDNVHALTIDSTAFNVVGTIDKTQYNVISIYNPGLGIGPIAKIITLPKPVAPYTKSFVTSNSAANAITLSNTDSVLSFAGDVPFSVSAWVKLKTLGIANNILLKGNSTSECYQIEITTANQMGVGIFDATGHYIYGNVAGTTFSANAWVHIGFSYDGGKLFSGLKFYINGSPVTATNASSGTFGTINNVGSVLVGSRPKNSTFGNFQVDHLAFCNIALTPSQFLESYHSGTGFNLTASSFATNLVAYYLFFNNLIDSSVNGTHTGTSTSSTYLTDAP